MQRLFTYFFYRLTALTLVFVFNAENGMGQFQTVNKRPLSGKNNIIEQIRHSFNSGSQYNWIPIQSETGLDGGIHTRFQQTFMGIPVQDAVVVVHSNNHEYAITGHFARIVKSAESLNLKQQKEIIQSSALADEIDGAEFSGNWVWLKIGSDFELVLRVDFFSPYHFSDKSVYLHPQTTEILHQNLHKCHLNHIGTAQTNYHGTCHITTQVLQNSYHLRSSDRGNGIITQNLNQQLNYNSVSEITDDDNFWDHNNIEFASDAHFCAEKYYDFLQAYFQRNSLDNSGFALKSYVNYGQNLANAFWNGSSVVYGSGNATIGALTVVDIAGHEFTHGLIQKTAGLNYSNEPGIINEAIADIFGVALDHYSFPGSLNWTIAERSGQPLRSFFQPLTYGQPEEYLGPGWYYGTGDNGGVHINSGFINHWFYLLSEGGNGTNSKGWTYSLSGIGWESALRIVFQSLTCYLVPQSGFEDFYQATLIAAIDLYGHCSPEYLAICEAWKAVGLKNHDTYQPAIISPANSVCQGQSVLLTASGLPRSVYNWTINGQLMINTGSSITVGLGGIYQVAENRCGSVILSDTFHLTILPLPEVTVQNISGCPGTPLDLDGYPSGGVFSLPNPYTGPSAQFDYTYTDSLGCSSSATAFINRFNTIKPEISLSRNQVPVNDEPVKLYTDSGTLFFGQGVSDNLFYPDQAGIGGPYMIEVSYTDNNGCYLTNSTEILVLPPCRNLSDTPEILVEFNSNRYPEFITLKALHSDGYELHWIISGEYHTNGIQSGNELKLVQLSEKLDVQLLCINTCLDSALVRKSIHRQNASDIIIYPNPVNDYLYVEGGAIQSYTITDNSGKAVEFETYPLQPQKIRIDTTGLSSGFYYLTVRESGKETKKSFIVK